MAGWYEPRGTIVYAEDADETTREIARYLAPLRLIPHRLRKPRHNGCELPGCVVSIDGWSDCVERACPGCGYQTFTDDEELTDGASKNLCLVCGARW